MNAELGLKISTPAPEASPEDVAQLVRVLREAGDWITAREIAARIGPESNERSVRAVASAAAPVVVSFPGSKGYKLWTLCSVEEINHAIESFESQGKEMFKRAVLFRRAYHSRFRGPSSAADDAQLIR